MKTTKKTYVAKTILVPVDFSDVSIQTLAYANAVAGTFGARLKLLTVLERPAVYHSSNAELRKLDARTAIAARRRLAKLAKENIDRRVSVSLEVRLGRAHQTICKVAKTNKCDLIVMGTQGLSGLKHLVLGSTTESVIRHAPCSVLVVHRWSRKTAASYWRPKTILAPTDFSEPATLALRSAAAIAERCGARLQLLYVVPVHYAIGDVDFMDYALLATEEKEEGQKRLDAIKDGLIAQNIPSTVQLGYGRPAVEINEAAVKCKCDLIVISTHGRTGWKRAVIGSTTEEMVRHASCPVLIVKDSRNILAATKGQGGKP